MQLNELKIIVTGGAQGMGAYFAKKLAEAGAKVCAGDVNEAGLAELPESVFRRKLNVADEKDCESFVAWAAETMGGLNGLINNAGILRDGLLVKKDKTTGEIGKLTKEQWDAVIGVHLNGTFFCTREALKLMSRQNRGAIVNLSSVAALMGLETVPHYSAAKGGILAFTRAVAREVGSRGIRVNAICPGFIDTPMTQTVSPLARKAVLSRTPLGRLAEPREVATTALFLVSDDASFFTGQWLSPNGGLFIG